MGDTMNKIRGSEVPGHPGASDTILGAYWAGVEEGIRMYAWWKDGRQYVGTTGRTLTQALKLMDQEAGLQCWHPQWLGDDGVEYCSRCGLAKGSTDQ